MRRTLMLVLVVALGALVFAPAAFAQDDNPSGDALGGDDRGGERAFDDNPSRDDLREDRSGGRGFDDNPTGDDVGASPTASPTASATASPTASASASATSSANPRADDDGVLPETGGAGLLPMIAGTLLVGGGIASVMLMRRTS
jgi:hypothetical protein